MVYPDKRKINLYIFLILVLLITHEKAYAQTIIAEIRHSINNSQDDRKQILTVIEKFEKRGKQISEEMGTIKNGKKELNMLQNIRLKQLRREYRDILEALEKEKKKLASINDFVDMEEERLRTELPREIDRIINKANEETAKKNEKDADELYKESLVLMEELSDLSNKRFEAFERRVRKRANEEITFSLSLLSISFNGTESGEELRQMSDLIEYTAEQLKQEIKNLEELNRLISKELETQKNLTRFAIIAGRAGIQIQKLEAEETKIGAVIGKYEEITDRLTEQASKLEDLSN